MSKKVLVVFLACVVPILGLSAQPKQAEEPLYGIWVNEQFGMGKGSPQKHVISPDGREVDYLMLADKEPWTESRLKIENQWIDPEGNCWYTLSWTSWYYGYPSGHLDKGYALVKISASGSRIERVTAGSRIPDVEDWSLIPHPVYYRQP